ncbi:ribokinase [Solicola sp. PLA-1-18]|uniref:ribokinase n=1 Tax=Solicola sp. PLA-1-18 TaxID=3380532 RepID=UPI003B8265D0
MSTDTPGVLVVGSITVDVTAFARRLPAPGETVLGDDLSLVLGGKGANQAVAAALAGADTMMAGAVGDDPFADVALDALRGHGVDVSAVRRVAGPTGVAHIRVDAAGENDIVMVPLANATVGASDVDAAVRAAAGRARVLLLQLETPVEVARHAARVGREAGLLVVLDPAPAVPDLDPALWADVDVVTPNETEARILTGLPVDSLDDARAAGRWFVERGAGCAVVTLGGRGVVVVTADDSLHVPARPVDVVDSTAAGDAFAGYLGAGLASGQDVPAALPRAAAAGTLTVTRRGASASLPAGVDVDRLARS